MHSQKHKNIDKDYKKVIRVIESCECEEHLDATNRLITYFYIKYGDVSSDIG